MLACGFDGVLTSASLGRVPASADGFGDGASALALMEYRGLRQRARTTVDAVLATGGFEVTCS